MPAAVARRAAAGRACLSVFPSVAVAWWPRARALTQRFPPVPHADMELGIYDSWFNPIVSTVPSLIPDAFIYLRARPGTCHKRMKGRSRSEEVGVSAVLRL
jgi:Deoxynucleoside kinase